MPGDAQGVSVPLSLFGGLVTELSAPDLPEGVSPDNQDVVFLPGSVSSRPGLHKVYSSAISGNVTIVYQKTYVQPDGQPINLILDSAGNLWKEDVINAPGTLTSLGNVPAGSYAQSCSAFGREYVAISDGVHGSGVPLQFDGTNLDRVSQDGPGIAPQAADYTVSFTIAAAGVPGASMVLNAVAITSRSEVGYVCSIVVSGIASIQIGDSIQVAGTGTAYDGTFTVSHVSFRPGGSPTTTISYVNTVSGLASGGAGGTVSSQLAQFTTTANIPFTAGQSVTVAGVTVTGYNGTWTIRAVTGSATFTALIGSFALANSGGGTVSIAGAVTAGTHRLVCMFLTRQGYITAPSPIGSWIAGGNAEVVVSGIPLGPSNVVARIIAFTGAGGDNFFYIPVQLTLPQPTGPDIVVQPTVINDNTSTSAIFNFSDNELFGATGIDIPGRNYFAQIAISDCLGFFSYASRLFPWGERNKIQNLLSMGFEGGMLSGSATHGVAGWTFDGTTNGTLINGGAWAGGFAWQITGDGLADQLGMLTQPAYQDLFGISILQPSTTYSFRCWLKTSANSLAGSFIAEFYSTSGGSLATATFTVANITTAGKFYSANFSAATPAVIPSDTLLRIYQLNMPNLATITIDECQVIPTVKPFLDNVARGSYVNAPEQFDGVTGTIGPATDSSPLRCLFEFRDVLYMDTARGRHETIDNATGEPSTWSVRELSQSVGALSLKSSDTGILGTGDSAEQFEFTASRGGAYIFWGGEMIKISQEIQNIWDTINFNVKQTVWIKNDPVARRCYFGVPLGTATAPNTILVLDYRELNTPEAIASTPPFRQSYSGKMIATELARKWTKWNIASNSAEILTLPNNVQTITFGAGNGQTPGTANGFGNIYYLDSTKLTDDDYGQIVPYWTSYFFVADDQAQSLQLDTHRKLATYLALFISGTGQTSITPLSDVLTNAYPQLAAYPLSPTQNHDLEWPINVDGECIAIKVGSIPNTGLTDNQFTLQKMILTLKKHPWSGLRGAL